jgi:hypothetical protein
MAALMATTTIIYTAKYAMAADGATAVQMIQAMALAPRFPETLDPGQQAEGLARRSALRIRGLCPRPRASRCR